MKQGLLTLFALVGLGVCLGACGGTDTETKSAPAQELSAVASLAASCGGCHMESGAAIASLSRLSAEELQARLVAYKTEDGATVMHRLARGYTTEQIASVSSYLADQRAAE
ncbi:MAG: cytochrome C [Pseudomonadota bacterium]